MFRKTETPPLIIQYTNLLHQHRGPNAKVIKDFRKQHASDEVFIKRADTLDKVWRLKESLL